MSRKGRGSSAAQEREASKAETPGDQEERELSAGVEDAQVDDSESEEAGVPEGKRLEMLVESLVFASEKPLPIKRIAQLTGQPDLEQVRAAIESLESHYASRGIVLHDVAGGYQLRTHPSCASCVQQLVAGKPVRLSRAQLETLAIIAYRQPITRPEIDEIRGVDSGGTLRVLLDRSLIRVLGKKEEPGRPLLYGTTRDFLEFFNLSELRDLPTLREYHELTEESLREVKKAGMDLSDLKNRAEPTASADEDDEEAPVSAARLADAASDAGLRESSANANSDELPSGSTEDDNTDDEDAGPPETPAEV